MACGQEPGDINRDDLTTVVIEPYQPCEAEARIAALRARAVAPIRVTAVNVYITNNATNSTSFEI